MLSLEYNYIPYTQISCNGYVTTRHLQVKLPASYPALGNIDNTNKRPCDN